MNEAIVDAQRTSGVFSILSSARVYDGVQRLVGLERLCAELVRTYVKPAAGERPRVLDLGCGTGVIVEHLGPSDYVGVDLSEAYVADARRRLGDRARFVCADVRELDRLPDEGRFDVALMVGLLHHLSDHVAAGVFRAVAARLTDGGRLVTIDPTFAAGAHPIGRFVASRDRGRHVRSPGGYVRLAREGFSRVTVHVRHDLLRIPYTHAVLECTAARSDR